MAVLRARTSAPIPIAASSALLHLLLLLLLMLESLEEAHAEIGSVAIGNDFNSPTQFTCNSNVKTRPTYIASSREIYYFVFDMERHQFWDCEVHNRAYARSGKFRFWGDDSHGGPELWNCVKCKWNVDQFAIAMYVHSRWYYHYFWPLRT